LYHNILIKLLGPQAPKKGRKNIRIVVEIKRCKEMSTSFEGEKPVVVTKNGRLITCAFKGKESWDNMIRTFNNRYLNHFIIDINRQHSTYIEKIKEELNKEFEWEGPPLSFICLKKFLGPFMKKKETRLKWH
jgi:hypothetical protein